MQDASLQAPRRAAAAGRTSARKSISSLHLLDDAISFAAMGAAISGISFSARQVFLKKRELLYIRYAEISRASLGLARVDAGRVPFARRPPCEMKRHYAFDIIYYALYDAR